MGLKRYGLWNVVLEILVDQYHTKVVDVGPQSLTNILTRRGHIHGGRERDEQHPQQQRHHLSSHAK